MTFAFPAFHRHRESFRQSDAELLAIVRDTINALGWPMERADANELVAIVRGNLWSWGERVHVRVANGTLEIESRCRLVTQCFDWGKNRRNVQNLLEALPPPVMQELLSARSSSGEPVAASTATTSGPRR